MTWQLSAAANAVIAAAYFAICWTIVSGLLRTRQLRTNPLGGATALIFFTCAVHHGSHTVHMVLPAITDDAHGLALRQAFGWQMGAWDVFGAAVAVLYLSLRSSYGVLLQTPAMFRDLARAKVEEAIASEHEALVEAQELGRMGSFRREVDGTWTVSEEYRRIFELEPGEDPAGAWDRVVEDDVERLRVLVAAARAGHPDAETDYRFRRRDGSTSHLHLRVRSEPDPGGAGYAVAGTVQDLTERVTMQEAVLSAEHRFRTAFEAAPIGVALISLTPDHAGTMLSANPALAQMLGRPAAELEGSDARGLVHDDERPLAHGLITALARGARGGEVELRLTHAAGHSVWATVNAAPLTDGEQVAVVNVIDVSQRKQFEAQLQHLADHDALTGLFNRRRFTEELEGTLRRTARYGDPGAILFLDLDGFKFVNDSFGHAVGDELIARVGSLFAGAVRDTDVVARVGGDEFAVILTHADEAAAVRVAENLLQTIRRGALVLRDQQRAQISTSIGITLFTADDELTADELLVEADIAMYDAKEAGKDRHVVFRRSGSAERSVSVREHWNRRLREALEDDRFVLHAQPIVPLAGQDIPTFELLLRLPDDHGDLIPPGTFLYNAERFDLIARIDLWVVRQAVTHLRESHAAGHDLRLTVNVSGRSMTDPLFGPHLAALLAEQPIPAGRLVIEITETAAITNIDRARTLAQELRALGCLIALDDFGAGFASFYYLKHLQVDYLKIDGEFIRNVCRTPTDQLVVRAVVDIALGLGTRTIAEFVEDEPTAELLRLLGVDHAQGFHLGRPAALGERLPHLRHLPAADAPGAPSSGRGSVRAPGG